MMSPRHRRTDPQPITAAGVPSTAPGQRPLTTPGRRRRTLRAAILAVVTALPAAAGCTCISDLGHAIPAYRLDPVLRGCPKETLAPVPLSSLALRKPAEYRFAPGDTLSVYVFGVLPTDEKATPTLQRTQTVNQQYYPPGGNEVGSRTGVPVPVEADGTVDLPLIGRINVNGLTGAEATERVIEAYRAEEVLQEGRERAQITLAAARTHRITVLREDNPTEGVALTRPGINEEIHRGSGEIVDLPAFENDVLHALAATGGLPGTDARREVWVIRGAASRKDRRYINVRQLEQWNRVGNGLTGDAAMVDSAGGELPVVTRIPLVGCPNSPLPFDPAEIELNEGDVLFVPRRHEHFVTGGMLPGARIPLPRDEDIDVFEAIAMSGGSVGGPLAGDGSMLKSGRPGHMREPTNVLVLRRLPDGRQLPIRVDLDRAMHDQRERILIRDEDIVMVYFKPEAAVLNGALNFTRFAIVPRDSVGGVARVVSPNN